MTLDEDANMPIRNLFKAFRCHTHVQNILVAHTCLKNSGARQQNLTHQNFCNGCTQKITFVSDDTFFKPYSPLLPCRNFCEPTPK